MTKMRRLMLIGVAVCALGAAVASSAKAISPAPYWTIGGSRLVAGKTHDFAADALEPFILNVPEEGVKIECSELTAEKGVLLGSNEGESGRDSKVAKFSGCKLIEGNGAPSCELNGTTLTTNQLISELVESVSGAGGGKQLLEETFPASGASFVTLHFTGSGCTVSETAVSGQVVGEVRLATAAKGKVELGQTPEQATAWDLAFPATAIKEVWLITNGVGKVAKTKQLAFADPSTQTGLALLSLANSKFESECSNWGPTA
jgi:hypothetical protein